MKSIERTSNCVGIGLRLPHIAEVVATRPRVAYLEIHPENFLANPHAAELLVDLSRDYAISVHTVGISVGTATGIDRLHLKRLRDLMNRLDPVLVSGHLAWSSYGGDYLNDLLPLPFNEEALDIVANHLCEIQDFLGMPYLLENPASYVGLNLSTMTEAEFFTELVSRTQCKLLCDVSNVYVSASNLGYDAAEYLNNLPAEAIAQMHLGGYTLEEDAANQSGQLLIDTHAAGIAAPSWNLYQYAVGCFGTKPTVIEWDNELPPLSILLSEAAHAEEIVLTAREAHRVARF